MLVIKNNWKFGLQDGNKLTVIEYLFARMFYKAQIRKKILNSMEFILYVNIGSILTCSYKRVKGMSNRAWISLEESGENCVFYNAQDLIKIGNNAIKEVIR